MPQCAAVKRDGERCRVSVEPGAELCWAHDPRNALVRKRITSKAGRSKPSQEIKRLKAQLEDLSENVLEGRVDRGTAAVINQILNTRARLIDIDRRIREQDEVLERIAALEESAEQIQQVRDGFAGLR
jgi:hypothetical protein